MGTENETPATPAMRFDATVDDVTAGLSPVHAQALGFLNASLQSLYGALNITLYVTMLVPDDANDPCSRRLMSAYYGCECESCNARAQKVAVGVVASLAETGLVPERGEESHGTH